MQEKKEQNSKSIQNANIQLLRFPISNLQEKATICKAKVNMTHNTKGEPKLD